MATASSPADLEALDFKNYFKLEVLMTQASDVLRNLFRERWKLLHGKEWEKHPNPGDEFVNGFARDIYKKLGRLQKQSMQKGDINMLDTTTLSQLLQILKTNSSAEQAQNRELSKIVEVRNKLAHHPNKVLDKEEFDLHWQRLSSALISLGFPGSKIEEFYSAENIGGMHLTSQKTVKTLSIAEANKLKDEANEAFRNNQTQKSINLYTQALQLPDLSGELIAVLSSNRSTAYLKLKPAKIQEATDDAKQAVSSRPTWWKSYYRLGCAYEAKKKFEKAVDAFNKALGLDPSQTEVRSARDGCRDTIGIMRRKEHLDPSTMPMSRDECFAKLNERSGGFGNITAKEMGKTMALLRKSGKPELVAQADVYLAHHYLTGMDEVQQNYEQAARLFSKAAAAGNAEAIYNLGVLTKSGLGVQRDIPLALSFFRRAAALPPKQMGMPNVGVAEAEHSLGLCYEDGIGVDPNFQEAIKWYERGSAHGCHASSNNLGLIYSRGQGVKSNGERAAQYWKLAASKGNVRAMESLEYHYMTLMDFKQAKLWRQRAKENGSLMGGRQMEALQEKLGTKLNNQKIEIPREVQECFEDMSSRMRSFGTKRLPVGIGGFSTEVDFDELEESATEGSKTAETLLKAFVHFYNGLELFVEGKFETTIEMMHEFAEAYRTEHIVARWPEGLNVQLQNFLESNLENVISKAPNSFELDQRICYMYLRGNALEEVLAFIEESIKRFPNEPTFYDVQGSTLGFLQKYQDGLECSKKALKIFPNHSGLLYNKAVHLRLVSESKMNETIDAYKDFLKVVPKDHRKVPESHYAIASCYLGLSRMEKSREAGHMTSFKKFYQLGLDAEENQLSCFMPYDSNTKSFLDNILRMMNISTKKSTKAKATKNGKGPKGCSSAEAEDKSTSSKIQKSGLEMTRLTDPLRVQLTLVHRETLKSVAGVKINKDLVWVSHTAAGKHRQTAPSKLTGLKPISFREMDSTKDHVYEGYVLQVLSIEDAVLGRPSVGLILADENKDFQRGFVYKIPQDDQIQGKLGFGSSFSILNPYMRIAQDQKPGIRVDDPRSIIFHSEPLGSGETRKMCRFCFSANTNLMSCANCKRVWYCSKECQLQDWKLLKHKLICSPGKK